jgi:hypothetical protein
MGPIRYTHLRIKEDCSDTKAASTEPTTTSGSPRGEKARPHLLQGNLYLISWFHFNQFNINDQELDYYYIA